MKIYPTYDLKVDQVVNELKTLIERHPDNTGKIYDEDDPYPQPGEALCVYFLDQDGDMISSANYEGQKKTEGQSLTTPVCIIGTWIHEFHPELKADGDIVGMLRANGSVGSYFDSRYEPFEREVMHVLSFVQNQQDVHVETWSQIDWDQIAYD